MTPSLGGPTDDEDHEDGDEDEDIDGCGRYAVCSSDLDFGWARW